MGFYYYYLFISNFYLFIYLLFPNIYFILFSIFFFFLVNIPLLFSFLVLSSFTLLLTTTATSWVCCFCFHLLAFEAKIYYYRFKFRSF